VGSSSVTTQSLHWWVIEVAGERPLTRFRVSFAKVEAPQDVPQRPLIAEDNVASSAGGSVIRSGARSRTLLPFGVRARTFTRLSRASLSSSMT
jgi:hypothetical protein